MWISKIKEEARKGPTKESCMFNSALLTLEFFYQKYDTTYQSISALPYSNPIKEFCRAVKFYTSKMYQSSLSMWLSNT